MTKDDFILWILVWIIWLSYYNNQRTHQGKMCCGCTPMNTPQAFLWTSQNDNSPKLGTTLPFIVRVIKFKHICDWIINWSEQGITLKVISSFVICLPRHFPRCYIGIRGFFIKRFYTWSIHPHWTHNDDNRLQSRLFLGQIKPHSTDESNDIQVGS